MAGLTRDSVVRKGLSVRCHLLDPLLASPRSAWPPRPALATLWLAVGLLGTAPTGSSALGAMPVGSQFQVNSYTTGGQGGPSAAANPDGNLVVVWTSDGSSGSDTSASSIQSQRYDASGNALGAEFQVNTYTTGGQGGPSAAADPDGNFVVVWTSDGSSGSDTDQTSVQGQRYDASGNALGAEFQVNTYTTGNQWNPSVALDADGNFVVVWHGPEVKGQRYDAGGNAVGAEFQVTTSAPSSWPSPSVSVDADGDFVVAWNSYIPPVSYPVGYYAIWGQRYDASGNSVGSKFQVNTDTAGSQYSPSVSVAADADGDFVVVWDRYEPGTFRDWDVRGQRHDASGNPLGSEFQVEPSPSYIWGSQPSVAADPDGGFVVVWSTFFLGGGYPTINGKHYDTNGNAGDSFQVNSYLTTFADGPAVAVSENGDFVVVWQSVGSPGSDNDDYSVQGQRYTVPQAPPVPSLSPPAVIGLTLALFGIAIAGLRGRLHQRG